MTTSPDLLARRAQVFARTDTDTLLVALLNLGAIVNPSTEDRLAHAWIADEIERRHPEITPIIETAFEDVDADRPPYSQLIVTAYAATRPSVTR